MAVETGSELDASTGGQPQPWSRDLYDFSTWLVRQNLARSTVQVYLSALGAFCRWWGHDLRSLRSVDVSAFLACRIRAGASPATLNRSLRALRRYGIWAKRRRRLQRDATVGITNLAQPRVARSISDEEADRVLEVVRRDRTLVVRAVLLLILRGRLSPSQVSRLRTKDVRLRANTGELRLPGRPGPVRLLLDLELAEALRPYDDFASQRQSCWFFEEDGQPLSSKRIEALLECYGRAAGVQRLTWAGLQRSSPPSAAEHHRERARLLAAVVCQSAEQPVGLLV